MRSWGKPARLADATWEPAILEQLGSIRLDEATIAAVVTALGTGRRPIAIERGRTDRQRRELALEHAAGSIDDAAYLARAAELRAEQAALASDEAAVVPAERAGRLAPLTRGGAAARRPAV